MNPDTLDIPLKFSLTNRYDHENYIQQKCKMLYNSEKRLQNSHMTIYLFACILQSLEKCGGQSGHLLELGRQM